MATSLSHARERQPGHSQQPCFIALMHQLRCIAAVQYWSLALVMVSRRCSLYSCSSMTPCSNHDFSRSSCSFSEGPDSPAPHAVVSSAATRLRFREAEVVVEEDEEEEEEEDDADGECCFEAGSGDTTSC